MTYALIVAVGLVAGTLGGIVGFGSTIMLMPVLVIAYGPREAVPIMAIAAIMANLSRVAAWWRNVDWRACAAYAVTAAPCAALGARTLLVLPQRLVDIALGLFFIGMIGVRRWLAGHRLRLAWPHVALAGAFVGFESFGALPWDIVTKGLVTGASLMVGAFVARRFVLSARRVVPAADGWPAAVRRHRDVMGGIGVATGLAGSRRFDGARHSSRACTSARC